MLDGKAFRQLQILAVAKPLQLACGPIRHIVGTLHQGHVGDTSGLAVKTTQKMLSITRRCTHG